MKTSILIDTTTASGNKGRKTVTDINPAATNAAVKSFAQQLVALTTDTYGSTSKVNIDALQPEAASTLVDLPLTAKAYFGTDQVTITDNVITMSWNDDCIVDDLLGVFAPEDYAASPVLVSKPANSGITGAPYPDASPEGLRGWIFEFYVPNSASDSIGDFVLRFPADTKYKAKTLTIRLTA